MNSIRQGYRHVDLAIRQQGFLTQLDERYKADCLLICATKPVSTIDKTGQTPSASGGLGKYLPMFILGVLSIGALLTLHFFGLDIPILTPGVGQVDVAQAGGWGMGLLGALMALGAAMKAGAEENQGAVELIIPQIEKMLGRISPKQKASLIAAIDELLSEPDVTPEMVTAVFRRRKLNLKRGQHRIIAQYILVAQETFNPVAVEGESGDGSQAESKSVPALNTTPYQDLKGLSAGKVVRKIIERSYFNLYARLGFAVDDPRGTGVELPMLSSGEGYGKWQPTPVVFLDDVVRFARISEGDRVYDFGSGDGTAAYWFASYGARVDGGEQMLVPFTIFARVRLIFSTLIGRFRVEEDFDRETTDGVISILEHFSEHVNLQNGDIFEEDIDFSQYDVIYLYYPEPADPVLFLEHLNNKLSDPKKGLNPEARLIVLKQGITRASLNNFDCRSSELLSFPGIIPSILCEYSIKRHRIEDASGDESRNGSGPERETGSSLEPEPSLRSDTLPPEASGQRSPGDWHALIRNADSEETQLRAAQDAKWEIENGKITEEDFAELIESFIADELNYSDNARHVLRLLKAIIPHNYKGKVIVIGGSALGWKAIKKIVERLPQNHPPIIINEHLCFYKGSKEDALIEFIEFANSSSRNVIECDRTEDAEPMTCYLERDMILVGDSIRIEIDENGYPVARGYTGLRSSDYNGLRGWVNALFASAARHFKTEVIAVVVSGSGDDGADGARLVDKNGGAVLVQETRHIPDDDTTLYVGGMPNAVKVSGVTHQVVPIENMADAIMRHASVVKKPRGFRPYISMFALGILSIGALLTLHYFGLDIPIPTYTVGQVDVALAGGGVMGLLGVLMVLGATMKAGAGETSRPVSGQDIDSFNYVSGKVRERMPFLEVGREILPGEEVGLEGWTDRALREGVGRFGEENYHEKALIMRNYARAIVAVTENPIVYYIGLGYSRDRGIKFNIIEPLLSTNFTELIGVELQQLSYRDFQDMVREQLEGIIDSKAGRPVGDTLTFSRIDNNTYTAEFLYEGKPRNVKAYFRFNAEKGYPVELENGYNVLIDTISHSDAELRHKIMSLLDDTAGFIVMQGCDLSTATHSRYADEKEFWHVNFAFFRGHTVDEFTYENFSEISSRVFFRLGKKVFWNEDYKRMGLPQERPVLLVKNQTAGLLGSVKTQEECLALIRDADPKDLDALKKIAKELTQEISRGAIRVEDFTDLLAEFVIAEPEHVGKVVSIAISLKEQGVWNSFVKKTVDLISDPVNLVADNEAYEKMPELSGLIFWLIRYLPTPEEYKPQLVHALIKIFRFDFPRYRDLILPYLDEIVSEAGVFNIDDSLREDVVWAMYHKIENPKVYEALRRLLPYLASEYTLFSFAVNALARSGCELAFRCVKDAAETSEDDFERSLAQEFLKTIEDDPNSPLPPEEPNVIIPIPIAGVAFIAMAFIDPYYILAGLGSLIAGIFLHELGHTGSIFDVIRGLRIKPHLKENGHINWIKTILFPRVTMNITRINSPPITPSRTLLGPALNLTLGLLIFFPSAHPFILIFAWTNLMLGVFNLIPIYSLKTDGARLLEAIMQTGDVGDGSREATDANETLEDRMELIEKDWFGKNRFTFLMLLTSVSALGLLYLVKDSEYIYIALVPMVAFFIIIIYKLSYSFERRYYYIRDKASALDSLELLRKSFREGLVLSIETHMPIPQIFVTQINRTIELLGSIYEWEIDSTELRKGDIFRFKNSVDDYRWCMLDFEDRYISIRWSGRGAVEFTLERFEPDKPIEVIKLGFSASTEGPTGSTTTPPTTAMIDGLMDSVELIMKAVGWVSGFAGIFGLGMIVPHGAWAGEGRGTKDERRQNSEPIPPSGITEITLNGDPLTNPKEIEVVLAKLRLPREHTFNALVEGNTLHIGIGEHPGTLHIAINHPGAERLYVMHGIVVENKDVILAIPFPTPNYITKTLERKNLCRDMYIKFARFLIEYGYPASFAINETTRHDMVNEYKIFGSSTKTVGDLARQPLSSESEKAVFQSSRDSWMSGLMQKVRETARRVTLPIPINAPRGTVESLLVHENVFSPDHPSSEYLIAALKENAFIKPGMEVLVLGAGSGYDTIFAANAVGEAGKVDSTDLGDGWAVANTNVNLEESGLENRAKAFIGRELGEYDVIIWNCPEVVIDETHLDIRDRMNYIHESEFEAKVNSLSSHIKPGGFALLRLFNRRSYYRRIFENARFEVEEIYVEYLDRQVSSGQSVNVVYKLTPKPTERDVIAAFNAFESDFVADLDNCNIERDRTGHINITWSLEHKPTGGKFIVQKINTIFDIEAIDNNLQLLERAQAENDDVFPTYWQKVSYLNLKGEDSKIYYDTAGIVWRVMNYVPGDIEIFETFNDVPEEDHADAARSLGEAICIFGRMLESIPQGSWKKPLPKFHDARYHRDYLKSVIRGEERKLSLSQDVLRRVQLNQ
ncbi:MAG: hypothetical protein HQ579_03740, partial [Candidatus Omnitrophica bacterium]|nr:hypothetical protein [Candidatus Omnitrophota bacterium]